MTARPTTFDRRGRRAVVALLAMLGLPTMAWGADRCRDPYAIGTSRIMPVGAQGRLQVGLKTYSETVALDDHEVVLTFDDGPVPGPTGSILDTLARHCVQATFFLIGRNAEAHPDLVRREIAEGHSIGNHSWSHPSVTLAGLSEQAGRAEIDQGFAAIERAGWGARDAAGYPHVRFFRFPGFADTPALLDHLAAENSPVFGTDLWASDWVMMSPELELSIVLERLERRKRGIILFHDTKAQTAAMLPGLLDALKARHYRIVHLVEGATPPPLRHAPAGWTSETAAIIKHLSPRARVDGSEPPPP